MNAKTSILATGVLMATLIAASPAAMADNHGKHKQGGKWDKQEMCENFREGKGPFNREERRAEMADRLKLTDEQREIWQEIHQERQQKHQQRMEQWQEKMEQRCGDKGERGKNRK
jgi:Spy/CpxP family protein refolding chaperone